MSLQIRVMDVVSRAFGTSPESLDGGSGPSNVDGWDSLGHIMLVGELEREFEVEFAIEEVPELTSVERIGALLAAKGVT